MSDKDKDKDDKDKEFKEYLFWKLINEKKYEVKHIL